MGKSKCPYCNGRGFIIDTLPDSYNGDAESWRGDTVECECVDPCPCEDCRKERDLKETEDE